MLSLERDPLLLARRYEMSLLSALPLLLTTMDSIFRSKRVTVMYLDLAVSAVVDASRIRCPIDRGGISPVFSCFFVLLLIY